MMYEHFSFPLLCQHFIIFFSLFSFIKHCLYKLFVKLSRTEIPIALNKQRHEFTAGHTDLVRSSIKYELIVNQFHNLIVQIP